jgi:hypothetical protein
MARQGARSRPRCGRSDAHRHHGPIWSSQRACTGAGEAQEAAQAAALPSPPRAPKQLCRSPTQPHCVHQWRQTLQCLHADMRCCLAVARLRRCPRSGCSPHRPVRRPSRPSPTATASRTQLRTRPPHTASTTSLPHHPGPVLQPVSVARPGRRRSLRGQPAIARARTPAAFTARRSCRPSRPRAAGSSWRSWSTITGAP